MATVRMKKGDKYADIFDSPETIKQAQLDGYSLCEQKKTESVKEKVEETQKSETDEEKTTTRGRSPRQ